eukprot:TRINITY_DN2466_c0_g1_i8.p1 TRINITY_DN2466_c0_g1~~TRINITY_DN2466_c0_g1_i8.p1  ORF type:complete len:953 (-),score=400.95 TRINITY_DN2466_c0_g1_i8:17-2875(-)
MKTTKQVEVVHDKPFPKTLGTVVVTGKPPSILDFHPQEIARQMSLIEDEFYKSIKPWEFLGQCWTKKDKEKRAPRIIAMINRFNQVSEWVATEILLADSPRTRLAILKNFIDIAEKLLELNNFNGIMEIISGLQNSSIFRLRQLWSSLDKQHQKTYEQLQAVVSRDQSYKALRAQLHSLDPPCVPYLGVYLTDLIFIEDGNPDFLQRGLINFVKCQFVSQVIREIRQYQDVPYCLEPVPFIRDYLLNVKVLSDAEMYPISLQIEARGANKDQSPSGSSKSRLGRQGTRASVAIGVQDVESPYASPYGELEAIEGYKFYEKDSDKNILLSSTSDEGRFDVRHGTLSKLVERLTFELFPDPNYLNAFLMSYQTFTTANELLDLLIMRFNMPQPKSPSKEQARLFKTEKLIPIHFRVMNVLKNWVEKYYIDFKQDTVLVQRVLDFIDKASVANQVVEKPGSQVKTLIAKKAEVASEETFPFVVLGSLFKKPEDVPPEARYKLTDLDSTVLAEQMTLHSWNIIKNMKARECLGKGWTGPSWRSKAPHIRYSRNQFSNVTRWIQSLLVRSPSVADRLKVTEFFLNVADKLVRLKNYQDSVAIIRAFLQWTDQLEPTFRWLNPKMKTLWTKLSAIGQDPEAAISPMRRVEKPALYLPLYETLFEKMEEIEGTMADVTEKGLINFEKRRAIYDQYVMVKLEHLNSMTFEVEMNGVYSQFMAHSELLSDDELSSSLASLPNDPPEGMEGQGQTGGPGGQGGGGQGEEDLEGRVKTMVLEMLQTDADLQNSLLSLLVSSRTDLLLQAQTDLERFVLLCSSEMQLMHCRSALSSPDALSASLPIVRHAFPSAHHLSLWSPRPLTPSASSSSSSSSSLSIEGEREGQGMALVEVYEREEGSAGAIAAVVHNPQRSDVVQLQSLVDRYEADTGSRPPTFLLSSFVSDSVASSLSLFGFQLLLIQ